MTEKETTIYLLEFALEVIEGEGLERSTNQDNWVIGRDIEEHLKTLKQVKNDDLLHSVIPTSSVQNVIFFQLKEDCKYYTEDGVEVTTDIIMKYPHRISNDEGYIIID